MSEGAQAAFESLMNWGSLSMTNQDGCKVDVAKIGKNRVALGIHEGADFVCTWMNRQECQQLIEQLMLVCERLVE